MSGSSSSTHKTTRTSGCNPSSFETGCSSKIQVSNQRSESSLQALPEAPAKVSWRERLRHFTWSQFEITMGTGAMAALMAQQPNSFEGVRTIGKIFFLLDIILFALFTGCIAFRFFDNPRAFKKSLHHPHESFFFGAYWVSIAFILYNMQEYGVRACGPWLVQTLEILYWIYVGCVLLVVVFQYHIIFDEEVLPVSEVMPAWLLPAYPFLILGPLSADLLNSQPAESGVPILIGGIMFAGFGWGIAFIMYTLYFTRLITRFLPTEPKRPGMYVAVGPAAYTANALVSLGMKAPEILPPDYLGITSGIPAGEIWRAVGVPAGIFVWLLGFWFFSP